MFKQSKRREPAITTLVGTATRVRGDIEFTGGCLVDGFVKGNVKSVDDEEATLSISERGSVEGEVDVPHVLLHGTVTGDVRASERIELGRKARVVGNVQYKLIEMAIGAEVNGKLIHESEDRGLPAEAPEESPRQSGNDDAEPVAEYTPRPHINIVGE